MRTDTLIVGQGIAGTVLHHTLKSKGVSSIIIDINHYESSSIIAAGLYNPIVFKRINISWMAEKAIPVLNKLYSEIEANLGDKYIHPTPIKYIFPDVAYQNKWLEKCKDDIFQNFITQSNDNELNTNNIKTPFGYGVVKNSGWINMKKLISDYKLNAIENHEIISEEFQYSELIQENNTLRYRDIEAKNIVFCEGWKMKNNPWFNKLPLNGTKGEIVLLHIPDLHTSSIINKNFFLIPKGNQNYLLGATYNWEDKIIQITKKAKDELIARFTKVFPHQFKIIDQKAAIRPTVRDRRPLVGRHHTYKNMYLLNGLGTKGLMLAPLLANQLTELMLENKSIIPETNIARFNY